VRGLGLQYREELILNINVFIVWGLGVQYGDELILNITVFIVWVVGSAIWRGTYS